VKGELKGFTLLPTSMGQNILVVSCGNSMGTAVLYFISLHSLLLYSNLHVFRRNILVGHIISTVQAIWLKAYISENSSFLASMIKDKGHYILFNVAK
jgi:hypothetical protein